MVGSGRRRQEGHVLCPSIQSPRHPRWKRWQHTIARTTSPSLKSSMQTGQTVWSSTPVCAPQSSGQVGVYRLSGAPQYLLPRHPALGRRCPSCSRVRVLVHKLNAGANGGCIHRSTESTGLHQVLYLQQKESQRMRERKAVCEKACVCNSEEIQRETKRTIYI
jgi:hypothetical protein